MNTLAGQICFAKNAAIVDNNTDSADNMKLIVYPSNIIAQRSINFVSVKNRKWVDVDLWGALKAIIGVHPLAIHCRLPGN